MNKHKILLFLLLIISFRSYNQVPVGEWGDHFVYNKVICIADAQDKIYAATPQSLYIVEKSENSFRKLSKTNGLSDVGISYINYNKKYNTLIIAYTNSNVDLIKNGKLINLPDIKNKPIIGGKNINSIFCNEQYAYLCCKFGVVVLDLQKTNIKETWYPGNLGNPLNISDLSIFNNNYYLATDLGLYYAPTNHSYLSSYSVWKIDTNTFLKRKLNFVETFSDKLLVNVPQNDSIDFTFIYNGQNWEQKVLFDNNKKRNLSSTNNKLAVSYPWNVITYDIDFLQTRFLYTYGNSSFIEPKFSIFDSEGYLWIGDHERGLHRNGISNQWEFEEYYFDGPVSTEVFKISGSESNILAIRGAVSDWTPSYTLGFLSNYVNQKWQHITPFNNSALDTVWDIISVAVNNSQPGNFYLGSWDRGLVEFNNYKVSNVYTTNNSILDRSRITDMSFDKDNNLWFLSSGAANSLLVKTASNNWYSYNLKPYTDENDGRAWNLFIDSLGYKWVVLPRKNGLIVFNDNKTISNKNDDQVVALDINSNTRIISNTINCLAQDLDGDIWVGTDKGIKVFYNPSDIFSGTLPSPQTILIEQDGFVQNLLEFENVTSIVVDGANRKWIGTSKAGLFLISADGSKELAHFTETNSSLISNEILTLFLNQKNGELFIGTDNGIVSYGGYATMGVSVIEKDEVYAFPNPVQPGYNGLIAIKGLTANANIKITDVNGVLVYQAISYGGQAVWNGKNFNNEKVNSGVYIVFSSDEEGNEKVATKILFIQ